MIRVTIVRNQSSNHIEQFTLLGHAEYAQSGQDIVCAGVSAVAFGTVNSIEVLLGVQLNCISDERDGKLQVEIPILKDTARNDQLQLLLESMVVMLDSIQQSYGRYVKIKQIVQ